MYNYTQNGGGVDNYNSYNITVVRLSQIPFLAIIASYHSYTVKNVHDDLYEYLEWQVLMRELKYLLQQLLFLIIIISHC